MKEGAWINGQTGAWAWITEHASWIRIPENARALGMAETGCRQLARMPWDFNGPRRKAILLEAMGHGFIRFRGHGLDCTFEHLLPQAQAIRAVLPFMARHLGPLSLCRFTNLGSMAMLEMPYADLLEALRLEEVFRSGAGPCP